MNRFRLVAVSLGVVCAIFLLVTGCGGKKEPKAVTTSSSSAAAPDELNVNLESSVTPVGSIGSLTHNASGAVGPGDTVRFDAVATGVSTGDRFQVDIVGTDWTIPMSQVAGQRFSGTGTVPSGVTPGTYKVQARIINPTGSDVASRMGGSSLVVMSLCGSVQAKLDAMTIHFALDKYDLDSRSLALLQQVDAMLRQSGRSDMTLRIEGHCDDRGTHEYNLALGNRRAGAAKEFFSKAGTIDPNKIEKESFGEERPLDPRSNEAAWSKNRRVEFKLSCDQ